MKEMQRLISANPGLYDELRHRRKDRSNRAYVLLEEVKESYPRTFNTAKPLPLAADVIGQMQDRYTDFDRATIEKALLKWCRRKAYRATLAASDCRYNLDGELVR